MRKLLLGGALAIALLVAGGWLSYRYFNQEERSSQQVETTVLLERLRSVFKLITVQGQYAELYHERNLREMTLYLPIPTRWEFSKEALMEVTGTVYVGYDMEQMSVTIDSARQEIRVSNLPEPTVLAIDHDIKYINLEESFFNSFTPEDYTQLNKNAKAILTRKAVQKGLLEAAEAQGNDILRTMELMAQGMGFTFVINSPSSTPLVN